MKLIFKFIFVFLIASCFSTHLFSQPKQVSIELSGGCPSLSLKKTIEKNTSEILNQINQAYTGQDNLIQFNKQIINDNGIDNINSIWKSSKFYCEGETIKEELITTTDGFEIRNIAVVLEEGPQEIVLDINNKGIISDLYFSVNQHQYKNVSVSNNVTDETRKNIIRDFMEALKTAYMRKDTSFINKVFSDKALIIVGRTIKKSDKASLRLIDSNKKSLYDSGENTTYKKLTKSEYIDGLIKVFKRNKSISVDFKDIEIFQHKKSSYESFYGVRLKQKWKTDNYSDYGILFFVIQFRENDHPIIWVRVWQDATTTNESQQVGLGEIQMIPN